MDKKVILIAGGSGFLGTAIGKLLETKDYTVRILTRSHNKKLNFEQFIWDPSKNYIDQAAFQNVYGVINLAGASLAHKRWTAEYKQEIIKSRVLATKLLVNELSSLIHKPTFFISASGIGIYGHRPDEIITENSDVSTSGFIPSLCNEWEEAAEQISDEIRCIILRTGIVLSLNDGYLSKTKLPTKLGMSSIFGDGNQIYSWIHIYDLCNAIIYMIEYPGIQGFINLTAPLPTSQSEISRLMSKKILGFGIPFAIPILILKIMIGEMANTLIESLHVVPKKLLDNGFEFTYPDINKAMDDLIRPVTTGR